MSSGPVSAKSVFLNAVEIADADERQAFVVAQCGADEALRREVERLLLHYAAHGSFLESPAAATDVQANTKRPSAHVGRYKLLELIGEGGMGEVWVAEQTEPVKRKVALKVVKPGMDSKSVLARFEAERQALALMDHPNIAKILDGGVTEHGRPFFVMELVKGLPLTEYCDAQRLTVRDRLVVFGQICAAVQHAHQKGIIHRDLKPSNILVTEHDGKPVPKVIDFGLAKALGDATMLTERTIHTALGTVVGTPIYMAPEQVALNALDVDTRTDIYALGVILYELLTGTTPLEKRRLKEAAWDEVRRVIREEEPLKPSLRLSDSGDALPSISAQRHTEPAALTKLVRGELDWIVMKALEKDRARRFDTANAMARDIERYLNDEAVESGPPGAVYRMRKFARKHRGVIVGTAAFMIILAAGTGVSLWQAIVAAKAKKDAQASAAETKAVLDFVVDRILVAAGPKGISGGLGADVTMRAAVEAAIPHLATSFKQQPLVEAQLRWTLGFVYGNYGDYPAAAKQLEIARDLYVQHLGEKHSTTFRCVTDVGKNYSMQGRHAEAARIFEELLATSKAEFGTRSTNTLAIMNNLAMVYFETKKYDAAIALHKETLAVKEATLAPDDPSLAKSMTNLANCYFRTKRMEEAFELYERALALLRSKLGRDDYLTLMAAHNLANGHREFDRYAEALKLDEETRSRRRANLGETHPDTIISMWSIAKDLAGLDRSAEAVPIVDECFTRSAGRRIHANFYKLAGIRLDHFHKANDVVGCRTTAEIWEKLNRPDADSLMQAARCRAVTAALVRANDKTAAAAKMADAEADKAMGWMRKAVVAGYDYSADLKPDRDPTQDHDLDALRDRDDFKKLVAELAAKMK